MDRKIWLTRTSILTLALIAIYISLHLYFSEGKRLVTLSSKQIADISTLINNHDTIGVKCHLVIIKKEKVLYCDSLQNSKEQTIAKIKAYLESTLEDKIAPDFYLDLDTTLSQFRASEFIYVLSNTKIQVSSLFWLTGKLQFLEIIFWSLFGVVASLLYYGSEAMRTGNFNSKELAVHVAKFFYAPLCTIIIILSINVLSSEGDVSIDTFQYWLIVLSFILGFFSGRTIELLNKIKDLILPQGKASDQEEKASLEISGKVTLSPQSSGITLDMTKVSVKLYSMNDPSKSDIQNPSADGSYSFSGLQHGDYVLKAEYKDDNGAFEAQVSVALWKDETMNLSLTKTSEE